MGRIDLYMQDCSILKAKQACGEGSNKLGDAKRGTPRSLAVLGSGPGLVTFSHD